jgi:hypothetical protein
MARALPLRTRDPRALEPGGGLVLAAFHRAFHASKENFHRRFPPLLLGVEGIECVHQTAVFFRFAPQSSLGVLAEHHRHHRHRAITITITTVAIIITIAILFR